MRAKPVKGCGDNPSRWTQKKAAQDSLFCRPSLLSKEPFERASRNDSINSRDWRSTNVLCWQSFKDGSLQRILPKEHVYGVYIPSRSSFLHYKVSEVPTLSSMAWGQVFSIRQVASNPLGSQPAIWEENKCSVDISIGSCRQLEQEIDPKTG